MVETSNETFLSAGLVSSFLSSALAPNENPPAGLVSSFFSSVFPPKPLNEKPVVGFASSFFSSGLAPNESPVGLVAVDPVPNESPAGLAGVVVEPAPNENPVAGFVSSFFSSGLEPKPPNEKPLGFAACVAVDAPPKDRPVGLDGAALEPAPNESPVVGLVSSFLSSGFAPNENPVELADGAAVVEEPPNKGLEAVGAGEDDAPPNNGLEVAVGRVEVAPGVAGAPKPKVLGAVEVAGVVVDEVVDVVVAGVLLPWPKSGVVEELLPNIDVFAAG